MSDTPKTNKDAPCSSSSELPTNTDMQKRFFDMTNDEIEKKVRLTPDEKTAVDNFLAAAKALPKSICIEVDDNWDGEGHLRVSKRITSGSCRQVASLRKKSLNF